MTTEYEVAVGSEHLDMVLVHRCLSEESYWASGRSFVDVRKSFEKSLCFGLYRSENNSTVGFCRVVTDRVSFAYSMDFFIVKEFRKIGLGKKLMNYVLNYPEVSGVNRWLLATNDAHKLYEKFGFVKIDNPENHMERKIR